MMLKVCHQQNIQQSPFWRGVNMLFNADFPNNLHDIATTYQQITSMSPLVIPPFIAAESASFILAGWLEGKALEPRQVTDGMVIQLAEHLGHCHQQTRTTWGAFHQPIFVAEQWPMRLYNTIKTLADNHPTPIPDSILNKALQQAQAIKVDSFVPIMLDLRWDQFLQRDAQLSALVDLDAFVYGPQAIELVLLEYLLNEHQIEIFKDKYQKLQALPNLTDIRLAYRLLLFLMNVLGEKQLAVWMAQSHRLDSLTARE